MTTSNQYALMKVGKPEVLILGSSASWAKVFRTKHPWRRTFSYELRERSVDLAHYHVSQHTKKTYSELEYSHPDIVEVYDEIIEWANSDSFVLTKWWNDISLGVENQITAEHASRLAPKLSDYAVTAELTRKPDEVCFA